MIGEIKDEKEVFEYSATDIPSKAFVNSPHGKTNAAPKKKTPEKKALEVRKKFSKSPTNEER